jgi:MFS family permease
MWPIFILIAFLYLQQTILVDLAWLLILFYMIYMLCGGIMTPPWFSTMGDIVPDDQRGRYFAKRNLITTAIALSGTLLFSFALDWLKNQQVVILGFVMIFMFGLAARLFSAFLFTQHHFPPFNFEPSNHITLKQFFGDLTKNNFGKFTLFVTLITFAQWIAGPYFSVYMLNDLNFNYFIFIFINLFSSITALFVFPALGKFGDKFGNVKLLRFGACIIPFVPLMWLITNNPLGILLGPQLLGGIGWTAFNLAAANFIYDNIPSQKRGEYIALYNLLNGLGIVTGGLIGGMLITFFTITFMNEYTFLFLLSGILRMLIVILFLPRIKEVRVHDVKPIFSLKNGHFYRWLYDISLRDHRGRRKIRIK